MMTKEIVIDDCMLTIVI